MLKKQQTDFGRSMHNDPIMRARRQDEERRKNSPKAKLKERQDEEVRKLQQQHAAEGRKLADEHAIRRGKIEMMSPGGDPYRLGTSNHAAHVEMSRQRAELTAHHQAAMDSLRERHQRQLASVQD